jgi:hypothetical protein
MLAQGKMKRRSDRQGNVGVKLLAAGILSLGLGGAERLRARRRKDAL